MPPPWYRGINLTLGLLRFLVSIWLYKPDQIKIIFHFVSSICSRLVKKESSCTIVLSLILPRSSFHKWVNLLIGWFPIVKLLLPWVILVPWKLLNLMGLILHSTQKIKRKWVARFGDWLKAFSLAIGYPLIRTIHSCASSLKLVNPKCWSNSDLSTFVIVTYYPKSSLIEFTRLC